MYGWGLGQDATEIDTTGLVPLTGPDAGQIVTLQAGTLAAQTAGQYSINPSTGQLQSNVITGIGNSSLLLAVAAVLGLMFFMKGAR